jgi:hypothetical protein
MTLSLSETSQVEFRMDAAGRCSLTIENRQIGRLSLPMQTGVAMALRDFFMKATSPPPLEELRVSYDTLSGNLEKSGDHL